jgi:hypothetical protein
VIDDGVHNRALVWPIVKSLHAGGIVSRLHEGLIGESNKNWHFCLMFGKGGESERDRGLLASLWLSISNDLYGSSNAIEHSLELRFNVAIKIACHHHNVPGTCAQ